MTSRELHELMLKKQWAEEEFYKQAGDYIYGLVHEKGYEENSCYGHVHRLTGDDIFGSGSKVLMTKVIENDGVSGSDGSEYEWELDELTDAEGVLTIMCEGYDFSLDDFEEESVVELAKKLEEYHA